MQKKIMAFGADVKALEEKDGVGRVSGYGSVFGVKDSYNEIVMPGAFKTSLKKYGMPALLTQHRDLAGVWDSAEEDDHGLKLEGSINLEVQHAREHYALAKQGALKGLSIGFFTKKDEYNKDGVRLLHEVELIEVSLVTFPANRQATISDVKSAPDNERDLEELLRDAGYSRTQAKAIVSRGFRGIDAGLRDVDQSAVKESLTTLLTNLKGIMNV